MASCPLLRGRSPACPGIDLWSIADQNIDTDAEFENRSVRSERPLTQTATNDDIHDFRRAVAGVLGTDEETLAAPDPTWRDRWRSLAALGVTGLCVPADHGGAGMEVEVAVGTAMELGAALHGSPYAGLVAGAHALATAPDDDAAATLLAAVVAGDKICGFGRLDTSSGVARNVDGAPDADALVLVDPTIGEAALWSVEGSWQVELTHHAFDVSRRSGDVRADPRQGHRLGSAATSGQLHGLLLAADALGGAQRVLDRTVTYAGERQAFGRPIGAFQSVQHRLSDHAVRLRGSELVVRGAARAVADDARDAARAVAIAELSVSGSVVHLLHDLLQLTGGIGFTWEYGLHFYERRAHQDARLAANPRRARQALTALEGWTDGR